MPSADVKIVLGLPENDPRNLFHDCQLLPMNDNFQAADAALLAALGQAREA
jgi:hypothetical protein